MKRTALVVVVVAFLSAVVAGQTGTKNGEWSTYGGDLGNTRYAPLDQITAANFNALEVAWRFKTDNLGPRLEFNLQSTPLMVKGVLYSTGGTRRAVVALDAATGEQLWMHSENEGPRGAAAPRQLSGRGLAYWSDGKEERILYVTPGYQLVALDAKTGNRIPGFGTNGVVDLKQNLDQTIDLLSGEIGLHATPVVARNVVIVGAAHRSGGVPTGKTNVKGYVRGFDVRTGKRLWIFHTIPEPGEFGNETWDKDSWVYTGNAGVWAQISVDEQLGLAYLPVESPTGDYFGGPRPGNGLFGETLVAVDLQTGKRKWHYQLVHHGIWDMDIPCPPILLDVTINGRTIKAVAQPTKQAFLYVFNRETGEPLWPIVEKPVEKGTVPGEWYSPTQPFPTRPAAYETQGLVIDDLINFTPELRAEAEKIVSRYKLGPIFTPPVASALPGPLATLAVATAGGGTNWPGGSFDPETQILYVSSSKVLSVLGLVPPRDATKNDLAYVQGNAETGARTTGGSGANAGPGGGGEGAGAPQAPTVRGLPLVKPPYGQISAIDMKRGEILWQVAHGETPDNVRNNPALKGLTIPRTGRTGTVGQLVTKTLLVAGEAGFGPTPSGARGAMLRAYDKASGKEAGAVYIPAPQTGSPMSYMLNGRQYIVVAVGGAGYSGELIAFRLPRIVTTVADEEEDATVRLLERARAGDQTALDELFQRHFVLLERWATGRLPRWARGNVDTSDLLQETMLQTFKRLDGFEPRGKGALLAYLRQAFLNRLRNQLRHSITRPMSQELDSRIPDEATSPLEAVIRGETFERYEAGLARLDPDDRDAIVMRLELGFSYAEVAEALAKPSADAARMAVARALVKLAKAMNLAS